MENLKEVVINDEKNTVNLKELLKDVISLVSLIILLIITVITVIFAPVAMWIKPLLTIPLFAHITLCDKNNKEKSTWFKNILKTIGILSILIYLDGPIWVKLILLILIDAKKSIKNKKENNNE